MATPTRSAGQQDEVPLAGVLAEFRTALQEEIEAARRSAAAGGIALLNGHRIGNAAGAFQYTFTLESALNLPDDSPGDLYVRGREPLEASVVAVEGLAITISVWEDMGDFIPRASLRSDLTHLLRTLIQRIEGLAGRENWAGARLLGEIAPSGAPAPKRATGLNARQADAVASSLGRDTTFIWGPPGTGKTRTIGTIGEELYRVGRSVLVVSHTNTAVDQAVLQVADTLGDDLIDGSVLRLGEPRDRRLLERPRLQAETHVRERSQELLERKAELLEEKTAAERRLAEVERLLAVAAWFAHAESELAALHVLRDEAAVASSSATEAFKRATELEQAAAAPQDVADRARELQRRLGEAAPLRRELERRSALLAPAERSLHEAERLAFEAEELHKEARRANALLRRMRGLPRPDEQERVIDQRWAELTAARDARDQIVGRLAEVREPLLELEEEERAFEAEQGDVLAVIVERANKAEKAAAAALVEAMEQERLANERSEQLVSRLEARLANLRAWQLIYGQLDPNTNEALEAIEAGRKAAASLVAEIDATALGGEETGLRARLREIAQELEEIEEALQRIEQDVIGQATVVATTLTRAYKRDSIQARRFDTVVLDEASMAPIPALWVVAGLSDANVVVVGDFKQLAPIKNSEHELAEKWLGRDVFHASGVRARWDAHDPPEYLVQLQVQYRMHPQISAIPNELVYEGTLVDGDRVEDDSALDAWYDRDWGHDAPVLLVDMAPLNAWVTSVKTGRAGGSRLNFLSATVAVDLAERLLLPNRPELPLGEHPRIIIASPYRPQARLLNLLVKDEGLERELVPGTAHTFQGSEAPVVIFDFVLDEPHRKARLFDPAANDDNLRLLNVALTRARRRLIVVADFDWLDRHANRRAVLRELVRFLRERYTLVSALDVIPAGLHARAAAVRARIAGGEDAPAHRRIVVTQEDYYPLLARDLDAARERVVIYSPFLTTNRLAELEQHLRAAVERGVQIYLVTRTLEERGSGAREVAREVEGALNRWGVSVLHKFHMHEKLVFIDEELLWSGSLNSLSFSDTQEIMERRLSREVVEDYTRVLRLEALLAAHETREDICPVCGGELVPAEGTGGDPFYWRCLVPDCYTRSIDQQAPRDGLIPCASCGATVEYRELPSGPYWRCTANRHHRQRVVAGHLRLPRMHELVPKRLLGGLEKRFEQALAGEQMRIQ